LSDLPLTAANDHYLFLELTCAIRSGARYRGRSIRTRDDQWSRSDLFQAGAFMRHSVGPAYLSGALAYGWQDVTTDAR
jgi:hypothetical protein